VYVGIELYKSTSHNIFTPVVDVPVDSMHLGIKSHMARTSGSASIAQISVDCPASVANKNATKPSPIQGSSICLVNSRICHKRSSACPTREIIDALWVASDLRAMVVSKCKSAEIAQLTREYIANISSLAASELAAATSSSEGANWATL